MDEKNNTGQRGGRKGSKKRKHKVEKILEKDQKVEITNSENSEVDAETVSACGNTPSVPECDSCISPNPSSEHEITSTDLHQRKSEQDDQQDALSRGDKKQVQQEALDENQKQVILGDDPLLWNKNITQLLASIWAPEESTNQSIPITWCIRGTSNQSIPSSPWGIKEISNQSMTSLWGNNEHPSQATASTSSTSTLQSTNLKPHSKDITSTQLSQELINPPINDIKNLSLSASLMSSTESPSTVAASSSSIHSAALMKVIANKGSGTKGRAVKVDVNFLPLYFDNLLSTVYQYDISIEPNLPKRLLPNVVEAYRKTNFKDIYIAFDGNKIAVTPKLLKIDHKIERKTRVLDENGKEYTFMVTMKEAQKCSVDFGSLKNYAEMRKYDTPMRALQMLEIVLKSPFLNSIGVHAGRSFYMLPKRRFDLGDNYELWTGIYQSTVLGSRPYINVDIAHKAFPSEKSIIDILREWGVNLDIDFDYRTKKDIQTHLKGLMLTYTMSGHDASRRTYKFQGFNANANTCTFKIEDKEFTINEYFASRGCQVIYPLLPTLKLGNEIKNITVPLEFCSVAGYQTVNKKCTEMQTRNMIKLAATPTDERRRKIMDMLQRIAHNQSPTLKQFGVRVGSEFAQIPARVLNTPELEYKNGKTVIPVQGRWRTDNTQFLITKPLSKYAVLIMDKYVHDNQVKEFCALINKVGASTGINIDNKYAIFRLDPFSKNFTYDMYTEMSKMVEKNIELLFCIIPDRGETYGKVKQCAELDCGILTQCLKANTLTKKGKDLSTVSNILLKVNVKLNGTNHKLTKSSLPSMMKQRFMLMGADVTHPSPGQENIPSVVGVVSSHDVNGFLYNKCWRLQDPKQEIISDFAEILKEHLRYFENRNKCLPDVILYFRDGVSEGQFQQVLTTELNAMYSGCQQYRSNPVYKPKITFIVVQKRHHTRFFPTRNSDLGKGDRRNNNVPPGTIVDTNITHPNESQFYLVSHESIQGVARPTKYCLLRDDSDFSIDDLQALTYSLCHFFARCTRSVSYPAPTYYAHLAASRGRVYIEGHNINMSKLDMEFKNRAVKSKVIKDHPMYFV